MNNNNTGQINYSTLYSNNNYGGNQGHSGNSSGSGLTGNYGNNNNNTYNNNNNYFNNTLGVTNPNPNNNNNSGSNVYGSDINIQAKSDSSKSSNLNVSKRKDSVNLEADLNSKSIEELIYIYYNQEEFVKNYLTPYTEPINDLKKEVDDLTDECQFMRQKYTREVESLQSSTQELNVKQEELKNVVCEKISCENKYTVENLINQVNGGINTQNSTRNKIMSDFLSKKIDFNSFCENYKEPSIKFHSLNIVKNKLYQVQLHKESN
eukprot:CAMPEP_0170516860 /NCGR_PEP_ID=MMETSP0209-20121228/2988_1 /TAXON_ID=665100 ORGANISM="Litonotus pictus, Strain P1" /NCGR_SAMPLE_ID=MMETSP0209 /ASSEMBLY_ACC=CAM_ASM_000301 /LENGTH=263 /DNA_ID=CAMNT_0010801923 /DNA_START=467 /DNA_END=1258 /DNA_ORIENTATION=+